MKRKALSARVAVVITLLLLSGIINIGILSIIFSEGAVSATFMGTVILAEVIVLLILTYLAAEYVLKPYQEMRRLYQRFIDGQVYEELFDTEYELMPQWDEVLKKIRHLLNKQDAIRMSKKQAEYLALQNQINPHFLYNTLEAIRGDAICAGLYSVAETTEALSIFFRYSITGVDRLVTLEEEIDNVENYFTIQHYRFGEKLKLQITYPKEEEVLQLRLPKLTIQPFVENAIYHGLEKKVNGGVVRVKVDTTEHKLLITVSDNGVGMPEEQVEKINGYFEKVAVSYVGDDRKKKGGIAMKNVNSRIKLLFGEDYGVHVYSVAGIGTDVKVMLPRLRRGEYEERTAED
ncbi:sensor histidine kinase [Extibacter muris]|uniref:sensor histidine kinase n=1 Tax=Extibacter muris TaxID=1796622 RepID=UPI001D086931|nr:histidine kinase [Extibacter muris]MCB6202128.1 histidine kinase [Extibacter muris]MCQ4662563.1 histidine kinase [Extibacter muris]MCQ4693197.1 histidine kinase [Extibacter muris]